jgi:cobalt/nickel transport system permease protein
MFKNNNFIERSIMGALSFFKASAFCEEHAQKNGFLQSLDPRIKAVAFLLFIITVMLMKSITPVILIYLFCLLLSLRSKINLGFFLKRTWVFIPLFSLLIAIPAAFSIITPGEPLFYFYILGKELIITRPGLSGAILFILRVAASVSLIVLLSLTTRHTELLKVLRIFKIPQVFVLVLGMCYRYIYLFLEIIENTYLAIKSRVGVNIHYKKGQSLVAWNIANLWQRSEEMNEEVYNAMLSRGYSGEPQLLEEFHTNRRDWIWLAVSLIFVFVIIYFSYAWKI